MKRLVFGLLMAAGMHGQAMADTITVGVNGMVCAFCVKGIEKSFAEKEAVDSVTVDMDAKQVVLTTKPGGKIDDDTIKAVIGDAGFATTTIERQK